MSREHAIFEFDDLVKQVLFKTYLHEQDRVDLEMELKQHLYDHYRDLVDRGCSHEQSIKETIDQFGKIDIVRKRIKRNYPSILKELIFKEIIIGLFLFIAVIIGLEFLKLQNYLLMSPEILILPLLVLIISTPFQHLILKRVNSWKIASIVTCVIYAWYIMASFSKQGLSLIDVLQYLFSTTFSNYINGYQGLFTFHTIHFFWVIILLIQIKKKDSQFKVWKRMIFSSFQYWVMIILGLFVNSILHMNSEGSTVFINLFFVSSALEQILIDPLLTFFYKRITIDFDSSMM